MGCGAGSFPEKEPLHPPKSLAHGHLRHRRIGCPSVGSVSFTVGGIFLTVISVSFTVGSVSFTVSGISFTVGTECSPAIRKSLQRGLPVRISRRGFHGAARPRKYRGERLAAAGSLPPKEIKSREKDRKGGCDQSSSSSFSSSSSSSSSTHMQQSSQSPSSQSSQAGEKMSGSSSSSSSSSFRP